MCVRILRKDGHLLGYSRDFVIYDTSDQKALVKSCYKALNIDDKLTPVQTNQYKISSLKNDMITPEQYEKDNSGDFREKDFIKLYKFYQDKLKQNQAMDFDDLLLKTVELFKKHPEALKYYQNKFKYIHVDEYQDTNKAQYLFVRLLAAKHNNIFVVGDGDQSIYRWRGADIRNIQEFESDYPGAKIVKLEQNYRSTQNILSLANGIIKHNVSRREKNLWTDAEEGEKIKYYQAYDEKDEARFVVSQVKKCIKDGGFKGSDFAVLYRTNAQSRALEDSLMYENISYKVIGGLKFYERKEIKDILAYFKLIVNGSDDVSFGRVINEPKRSIGDKTIEKIQSYANDHHLGLLDACEFIDAIEGIGGKTTEAIKQFHQMIHELRAMIEVDFVTNIFDALIEKTQIISLYEREKSIEADARIDNIYEFKTVIEEFEKRQDEPSLRDFLAETSLRSDQDNIADENDCVLLMTLHASKGLEFPVVFLVGLEDNLFPSFRAMDDDEELEEERRLCYVGITRAEKQLYVTHAKNRNHYGRFEARKPSIFFSEMDQKLIEVVGERTLAAALKENKPKEVSFFDIKPTKKNSGSSMKFDNAFKSPIDDKSMDEVKIKKYNAGDKVMHKTFGTGMIVTVDKDGVTLTIVFDANGIKKLHADFAPIKIIG